MQLTTIQQACVLVLPFVLAVTVHEVAHGYLAYRLGDDTARREGRITLNPLKHLDPVGTLLVPLLSYLLGSAIFGWAKPVPVNPQNLNQPRRDLALIALAGPVANLCMAILWAVAAKGSVELLRTYPELIELVTFIYYAGYAGLQINLAFAVFNLLPIPPLDGSRLINLGEITRRYGFILLAILAASGLLFKILTPPILGLSRVITQLLHLPLG